METEILCIIQINVTLQSSISDPYSLRLHVDQAKGQPGKLQIAVLFRKPASKGYTRETMYKVVQI
jgi:hypothetical protein